MAARLTYTTGSLGAETDSEFEDRLHEARTRDREPARHLIEGVRIADGPVFERPDPANVEAVASRAHAATPEVVHQAVAAAKDARKGWRTLTPQDRAQRLLKLADAVTERSVEIAAVISLETGKSRVESLGEVHEAIDLVTMYSGFTQDNGDYRLQLKSLQESENNYELMRPYGVFGVLCPFNFPFALTIGMTVSALLAGNTVVVKPSEEAPLTGELFVETMASVDIEPGVFNLIQGGPEVGKALVASEVDGIAFTGSAEVGRAIVRQLQDGRYARPVLTEMGGKNPTIVTADADVEAAAEGVARAAFSFAGQKCSACSRVIVAEEIHDEFVEKLVAFTESLEVGDPADRESWLGPVINEASVARYEAAVEIAKRDGRIAIGGARPDLPGNYVEPTVVTDLPKGHDLHRRELFLPFVTVAKASDLSDALEEANAVDYGLTAGIFTRSDADRDRFLDEIEAGVVYVNRRAGATTGAWPGAQTFCGWKSSGTTGKGGLGRWYLPQFMREQSRTVVG